MVFFDWDSTRLSPASLNVLEQARDAFKAKQGARVTATGHTDTTGTEAYNMAPEPDSPVGEGGPPKGGPPFLCLRKSVLC